MTTTQRNTFCELTPAQLRDELLGMPEATVGAVLRFQSARRFADLQEMLPGIITYHLPAGAPKPPAMLAAEMRLREDIGLDSLALAEMAFKLDELFGVSIETHEVAHIITVADLWALLRGKLEL